MNKYKPRYLEPFLKKDLKEKILIITGPRQSGKTMLSKHLHPSSVKFDYFNYFDAKDRLMVERQEWNPYCKYLVFDELHIKKNWKQWLKALYEKTELKQGIIVTGSARLEAYKRTGDSLAGCFFPFRLHPLDVKEICQIHKKADPEQILTRLLEIGGFPEPYLKGSKQFYRRWANTHTSAILKEDMLELDKYQRISQLETLLELLKTSVGSAIQYENLSKILQCDGKTVKKMLNLLEGFYFIFKIQPYYKNIRKSIRKQPKYYFYDIAQVSDKGARFENLVACALLKNNHFKEDCYGEKRQLYYLKNKDKKEIDFLITKDNKPFQMIETKWKDEKLTSHFDLFTKDIPDPVKKIQLVRSCSRQRLHTSGCHIWPAADWLKNIK